MNLKFLTTIFVQYPILLFAITIHEYAHGWAAEKCGDNTARLMGRLTLNPFAHIDIIGTVILPLIAMISGAPLFGWAKPVPVNITVMTRTQVMFVGLAGPLGNLISAGIFSLIFYLLKLSGGYFYGSELLFYYAIMLNIVLAVFNLVPIPPLDGSRVVSGLLPYKWSYYYNQITPYGFFILILLISSGMLWDILSPIVNFLIKLFI